MEHVVKQLCGIIKIIKENRADVTIAGVRKVYIDMFKKFLKDVGALTANKNCKEGRDIILFTACT